MLFLLFWSSKPWSHFLACGFSYSLDSGLLVTSPFMMFSTHHETHISHFEKSGCCSGAGRRGTQNTRKEGPLHRGRPRLWGQGSCPGMFKIPFDLLLSPTWLQFPCALILIRDVDGRWLQASFFHMQTQYVLVQPHLPTGWQVYFQSFSKESVLLTA